MTLTGEPRIADEGEGGELRGRRIELGTRSRNVTASGNVRHTITRKGKAARRASWAATSRPCSSAGSSETETHGSHRADRGRLLVGREVRAPVSSSTSRGRGDAGSRRAGERPRSSTRGQERTPPGSRRRWRPAAATWLAESARRIVYTGDVEIRQGDILTRSPEAVVTLAREGGGIDRMIAGEPVEVVQGARRATGERGTYTPADETFVLVGEKVVLQDVDRRVSRAASSPFQGRG